MSDYKRFVSYFYPYTPDKQPRSVGFVKIEVRDKRLKMDVQVKGITDPLEKQYSVYLFSDDGGLKSFQAGTLKTQKNGGIFRKIMQEEPSESEKFSFSKIIGTILRGEDKTLYVAYWGKQTFSLNEIVRVINKKTESKKVEIISDIENSSENFFREEDFENRISDKASMKVAENAELNKNPEELLAESIISKLEVPLEMKEKQFEQRIQEVNREKNIYPEERNSEEVIQEINNIKGECFFENPMFFDCQKIEPKDLRLLPTKEWILGKNSFLLHGYYNYRHLLYGKVNKNGSVYLFLGVPGVFHNQEKFMANLFGFSEFEPVKKEDIKTGKFGYWIRIIDKV